MCRFMTLSSTLLVCLHLAACSHTSSKASAASVQYTLAVLPWNITGNNPNGSPPFEITMREFQDELVRSAFMASFSYYNLQESTPMIKERPGIESLWRDRTLQGEPDHQIAFQLGAQLGVDALITYAVAELWGPDYISVYLFDIGSKRVHIVRDTTTRFWMEGDAAITAATRQVFAKFLKHRG